MKQILRTIILLAIILPAFRNTLHAQQKFNSAIDMNDYLIVAVDSLYNKGQALGTAVGEGLRKKDFSRVRLLKTDIVRFCARTIPELKAVKDQYGSEDFRKELISFLEFEMDLVKTKLPLLDSLNQSSNENQVKAAIDEMIRNSTKENEFLQKVGVKQKEFARKNGFILGNEEED